MKYLVVLLILASFTACQRHYPVTADSAYTGTNWIYRDYETDFEILFLEDGTIVHSKSGDNTAGNDYWYEKNGKIYLYMNNGYARYKGERVDSCWVSGTARNKRWKKWDWQMKELKQ